MSKDPVCGVQTFDLCSALLVLSCLLATAPGCANPLESPAQDQRATQAVPSQYDTETVSVVLPKGDTQAGRQAFLDLKCTVCHRVVGETTFPAPVGGTQGRIWIRRSDFGRPRTWPRRSLCRLTR